MNGVEEKCMQNFFLQNLKGRDQLGYFGVDGITILKRAMKVIGCENADWIQLTLDPVAGSCEHGNESSGSMKDARFLDQMSDF
jgi:hypothetical protein